MVAQENVALAWSLFDRYNSRQSDPAWLDKGVTAFAADSEVIDVPSGATLRGPDGYKRLLLFFAEGFPDSRTELTNAFATEDQVVLETTWRWTNSGPCICPRKLLQRRGARANCGCVMSCSSGMGRSSVSTPITI